jgi:hypothetical protein
MYTHPGVKCRENANYLDLFSFLELTLELIHAQGSVHVVIQSPQTTGRRAR